MFHRIRQYDLIEMDGQWFRPRAYGSLGLDGTWDGWLVFFRLSDGGAIAPDRETTQSTYAALTVWAAGVTPVYLEGALTRALRLAEQPSIVTRLESAEYEALADAERLESAADAEREAADLDEAAAAGARDEAERVRRDRLAAEDALAAADEAEARVQAALHEGAAQTARDAAADAARRRQHVRSEATGRARPKTRKK